MGCSSSKTRDVEERALHSNAPEVVPKSEGSSRHLQRRVKNVFTETIDEDTEVRETAAMRKDESTSNFLMTALRNNTLLREIFAHSDAELRRVVAYMERREVGEKGSVLIQQGDRGDFFYAVESGTFDFEIDGEKVLDCGEGGSFGELALLYGAPRAATVRSTSANAVVWAVSRSAFRSTVAKASARTRNEVVAALHEVKILRGLTETQFSSVADAVQVQRYAKGTKIINKGDTGDVFYMIQSGEVDCTDVHDNERDFVFVEGEYFGERALLTDQKRAANVFAKTDVCLLSLDREAFQKTLGPLRALFARNLSLRVLSTMELLTKLSPAQRQKAAELFQEKTYATKGTLVIKEGDDGTEFFIVKSGTLTVRDKNSQVLKNLGPGDFFGETALYDNERRKASVVTESDGAELFVLTRRKEDSFLDAFSELKAILEETGHGGARAAASRVSESADLPPPPPPQSSTKENGNAKPAKPILKDDLKIIANLGSGTFGRVKLVTLKQPGTSSSKKDSKKNPQKVFALKTMHKDEVVAHQQVTNVLNEKRVMEMVQHPFVLKLVSTFQDNYFLYLLLEFCQGGELFSVLHTSNTSKRDGVPEPNAKFYASCVVSALAAIHDKHVAYRDLKPENVMIDAKGYAKIVDFGFAKIVKRKKTYTLCGTSVTRRLFSFGLRSRHVMTSAGPSTWRRRSCWAAGTTTAWTGGPSACWSSSASRASRPSPTTAWTRS